jgi:hypothetical protein
MEENTEKPINNGEKMVERNPDGTIKSGVLNPKGKPKGALSFATKWERMVEKIAMQNNLTPEEIDEQLLLVGYKRAKEGDYSFYRDAMDRIHGKPMQPTELDVKGNLTIQFAEDFKNKDVSTT